MPPLRETFHQWHTRALEKGTKQASMFAVGIPFIVITSIVVFLRVHVRLRLLRLQLAADDYLMIIGTFFTIGLSIANMICGWYGVGMHTPDIPAENLTPMLQANLATRLLYVVAICLVKFSILTFYRRLDPRQVTRWIVHFLMVWVAALSVVTFFVLLFVCTPPSLFWDPVGQAEHPEKCLKLSTQQVFFNINGVMNIIQDTMIYVLPMSIVWKLQMPRRQKIALSALLCVGLVAVAAGCVRFYYVLFLANETDTWFYMADSLNWCSIEIYAAIICSSASTFKALLKTYLPRIWGSSGSRGGPSIEPRNQYDQSQSGVFVMKPFGTSSDKSISNRKYGISGLTEIDNDSEEAIITSESKRGTRLRLAGEKK
ncbi:Nn.00g010420.m01.CDS01 [Neocucurbitaria sp. VM-36]